MEYSPLRSAAALALGAALISGTNNFLTKIAVTAVKDPVVYTTLKNAIVAMLLVGIVLFFRRSTEIRTLSLKQWGRLLLIGAIGGSLPFALYFTGLMQTSALSAGLIHKTLFLWVLVLAIPFLKERVTPLQLIGVAMIFSANLLIGGLQQFHFGTGEMLILSATVLWAIENIIAKKALRDISALTVAASRMVFGSLLLIGFVFLRNGGIPIISLNGAQWGWTLLTSALLLGYVVTWYTALKHAPATYVAILLVPATLVTNTLSAIFITHTLLVKDLASALLYIIGAALVILFAKHVTRNQQRPESLSCAA